MTRFQYISPMTGVHSGAPAIGLWWVDDSGRLHPHDSTPFQRHQSRVAFSHYGMVFLLIGRRSVTVRWNVDAVADGSIVGAARALAQLDSTIDITLEFFWGGWRREPGYRLADAFARMADLALFRDVDPFTGSALVQRQVSGIGTDEGALVWKTFEAWDGSKGDLSTEDLAAMMPYFLTFVQDRRETALHFDHVGHTSAGVSVWGAAWAADALGRVCHRSQPDYEFDDRVCETYYDVLETGEPRLEHVRAIIRRENADPAWLSYRRLVVRARDRMGVPTVVSLCDLCNDLSVPFMAA